MATDRRPILVRWAVFVRERFPLPVHLPLVLAFGGGNLVVALHESAIQPEAGRVAAILVVTLLFFFRLRLFDELKDHDTDLDEHPERPLPRGLVSVAEANRVTAGGLVLEGATALFLGWAATAAWAVAALYSLLMYREFFCGAWLRPKMELYALTHTLVAGGLGGFIACAATRTAPWNLPPPVMAFALVNWSVFNVFEFARKTYGRDESDGRAETYSQRLGPVGAVLLSLGWAGLAVFLTGFLFPSLIPGHWIWPARLILLGPPLIGSIFYLLRPQQKVARIYRALFSSFLFVFYVVLISAHWLRGSVS